MLKVRRCWLNNGKCCSVLLKCVTLPLWCLCYCSLAFCRKTKDKIEDIVFCLLFIVIIVVALGIYAGTAVSNPYQYLFGVNSSEELALLAVNKVVNETMSTMLRQPVVVNVTSE